MITVTVCGGKPDVFAWVGVPVHETHKLQNDTGAEIDTTERFIE